jgi:hypothetical protein
MDPQEAFDIAVQVFETVVAPKLREWGFSVTPMKDPPKGKEWVIESHNKATTILITPRITGLGVYEGGIGRERIMPTWRYPSAERAAKVIRRKLIKVTTGAIVSICRRSAPPEFIELYKAYCPAKERVIWWAKNARTVSPSEIALTLVIEPTRLLWKWIVEIERKNKFIVRGDENPVEAHHRILKTGISIAAL